MKKVWNYQLEIMEWIQVNVFIDIYNINLGKNGTTGHTGTDGSNTSKRISRYGLWKPGPAGQNISYGKVTGQEGN